MMVNMFHYFEADVLSELIDVSERLAQTNQFIS
jgi:hypothetical protein